MKCWHYITFCYLQETPTSWLHEKSILCNAMIVNAVKHSISLQAKQAKTCWDRCSQYMFYSDDHKEPSEN